MNADERKCPECAETIKRDANVCRFCGHRFRGGDPTDGPRNEAEQKVARNSKIGCAAAVIAAVLLVAFCSPDAAEDPSSPKSGQTLAETENATEDAFSNSGNQMMVVDQTKEGVMSLLKDPDSADFKDVGFYSGGRAAAVCGHVNAKNGFGGFIGFQRFIGSGEDIVFLESDMEASEFTKAWNGLCVRAERDDAFLP